MQSTATQDTQRARLELANHVIRANTKVRREISALDYPAGVNHVARLLMTADMSGPLGTMKLGRLLRAVHGMREKRIEDMLGQAHIFSANRRLRSLTPRERHELAGVLKRRAARTRAVRAKQGSAARRES